MKIIVDQQYPEELAKVLTKIFIQQLGDKDIDEQMVYKKMLKKIKEKKYLS